MNMTSYANKSGQNSH